MNSAQETETMSTLPLRIPRVPQPFAVFARVFAVAAAVIEVFAEAQEQASAAHRRYPFVDR
jgi:hypothetical protein